MLDTIYLNKFLLFIDLPGCQIFGYLFLPLLYIIPDYLNPFLPVILSYSSSMGTDGLSSLAPLGAPASPQIHTTLSMDSPSVVNNIKAANPSAYSLTPAVADHTPHPRSPSLQAAVANMIVHKSTSHNHAYSRAQVIKPGTYSRSLSKTASRSKDQGLSCAGCTAVHSLGIDHCHKHDDDKNAKGPHKRLRR
jgi:hypothetical protein